MLQRTRRSHAQRVKNYDVVVRADNVSNDYIAAA